MVFIYLFNKVTQYILGHVLYQVDRPLQTLTSPPAEAKLISGISLHDERANQTIPTQEGLNKAWLVPSSKLHSKVWMSLSKLFSLSCLSFFLCQRKGWI